MSVGACCAQNASSVGFIAANSAGSSGSSPTGSSPTNRTFTGALVPARGSVNAPTGRRPCVRRQPAGRARAGGAPAPPRPRPRPTASEERAKPSSVPVATAHCLGARPARHARRRDGRPRLARALALEDLDDVARRVGGTLA